MHISKYRIALDAMGGDFAPLNEIEGTYLLLNDPHHQDVEVHLIGNQDQIEKQIKSLNYDLNKVKIIHASDQITMKDDPTDVIKKRRNSSLYIGAEYHAQGNCDAFASAGNTGAMLAVSTMVLGRIKGVSRPSIGTVLPTIKGNPVFLMDVGATVDLKPRYLYEYAVMGSIYLEKVLNITTPRVGLLNVGEEESKGTEAVKETYHLLKSSKLNFVGNVEGRDIMYGDFDLVICDGFVGNIVLKFAESFLSVLKSKIKDYSEKSLVNKLKTGLMVPIMKEVLLDFDYQNYGGVALLGVNGVSIIGHGKSSPLAIKNMLLRAKDMIKADVNKIIENALIN
ncbi:MAG TPA: phosphate acyltransferase PlsX [Candidatus Kapabacteria bacterium]|nr:phosphate acyltransferase PlsX [Candidatus Kapabacteria bacterium]